MSIKAPLLSQLPLEVLLIYVNQYSNNIEYVEVILNEIKKRSLNYSIYQLCQRANSMSNKKLKKLYLDILYDKLPTHDGLVEMCSLEESLHDMSLEQICSLTTLKHNTTIETLAIKELDNRTNFMDKIEKVYQKKKGREEYAKHKRK